MRPQTETPAPNPGLQDNWDLHWSAYTEAAEHNPAQHYRRRLVIRFLRRFGCRPDSRILDIGSGQGDLARDLRAAFRSAEIAGVELSAHGVAVSSRKMPQARFFQEDLLAPARSVASLRNWARFAVCSEVLEHVDDPVRLLAHARAYLAPGCVLVITVPGGPQSAFDRHIGHREHFTPARIQAVAEAAGFSVDLATSAGFPFFNLYRMVVMLRGARLVEDVRSGSGAPTGRLARAAMAAFRPLFLLNLESSPWGWQTVAVARVPGTETRL